MNSWINIHIHGGWSTENIQLSDFSLKFEDGNQYTLEDAINNKYIEPLVILYSGTYDDKPIYVLNDILNIFNGGATDTSNYSSAEIVFKVKDKSSLIGFNLNSSVDFSQIYNDGFSVYQFPKDYEISTQPW